MLYNKNLFVVKYESCKLNAYMYSCNNTYISYIKIHIYYIALICKCTYCTSMVHVCIVKWAFVDICLQYKTMKTAIKNLIKAKNSAKLNSTKINCNVESNLLCMFSISISKLYNFSATRSNDTLEEIELHYLSKNKSPEGR